jgi:hypothetical protein
MNKMAAKNMKMEMRLMPCMYLIHDVVGAFGSFFLMYRYSASWRQIPMGQI